MSRGTKSVSVWVLESNSQSDLLGERRKLRITCSVSLPAVCWGALFHLGYFNLVFRCRCSQMWSIQSPFFRYCTSSDGSVCESGLFSGPGFNNNLVADGLCCPYLQHCHTVTCLVILRQSLTSPVSAVLPPCLLCLISPAEAHNHVT